MRRLQGSHVPNIKNRSSKHLSWLTRIKPVFRCVSLEQLKEWAYEKVPGAQEEITRRTKLNKTEEVGN